MVKELGSARWRKLKSDIAIALILLVFVLTLIPVFHIIISIAVKGISVIAKNFPGIFIEVRPIPGSKDVGGIGPYIAGSLVLTAISSAISIPIAITAALFTSEAISRNERRLGRLTRLFSHMLVELPTIIIGISIYGFLTLINTVFRVSIIPRFSVLSGVIALVLVTVPYMYARIESALRGIPQHLREAIYSLGVSRIKASMVLLKYISSALYASMVIGLSRMLGETASLLFTALGNDYYTFSDPQFLLKPIGTLTLAIFNFAISPYENWIDLSWAAAFILLLLTLSLFIVSKVLVRR